MRHAACPALAPFLTLLLVSASTAAPPINVGDQWTFRGGVSRIGEDRLPGEPAKTFTVTYWVTRSNDEGTEVVYLVEEQGAGAWPWIERVGRWQIGPAGEASDTDGPAVYFDRDDGTGIISLPAPLFTPAEELTNGAEWTQDKLDYQVEESADRDGREVWQVAVTRNYGRWGTIWLESNSPIVVARQQRVFMGQGEEHQLEMQLASADAVSPEALARITSALDAIDELRGQMQRARRTESPEFGERSLPLAREQLPNLEKMTRGTPLESLVRQARRDFTQQSSLADDVTALAERYVGRPTARFKVDGLGATGLSHDDLKGKVTVLHFWDYRDNPLKEPYGQVGYLDFLHEQRKKDGVSVYGVAVDGRLDDETTRPAAMRSIRKLKSFMNLGYPLLLDGGATLKEFGDPRKLGSPLPLFVVIDRQGQISHYHVGHYEVDRDAGLTELDAAVSAALRN